MAEMGREDRKKALGQFFVPGPLLAIPAGESRRLVCLTDFEGFAAIYFHRSKRGRVWCPKTYDEERACSVCDKGVQQFVQAGIPVWNFSDKRQQIALFGGPKRGPLNDLLQVFNALGTHKSVLEVNREGEGFDTKYHFTPVTGEAQIPEGVSSPSKEGIKEAVDKALSQGREESEW